jgi:hypothetical protein
VLGTLYAFLGLFFGGIMTFISLIGAMAAAQQQNAQGGALFAMLFGAGAVIFLPIFYGVMGFIMGIIMAAIYNLASGIIGGLELDFDVEMRPT